MQSEREKLIALLMEAMEEGEKECLSTANCPDCRAYEKYSRDECGLALSALHLIANGVVVREKGILMNPIRKYRKYYSDDYCPVCGKQQKTAKRSMEKPWYCERCGQKLGWDGFNQFPQPPKEVEW